MSMLQTAVPITKLFLKRCIICHWFSNLDILSKYYIFTSQGLNTYNAYLSRNLPWMMSLFSETVPSDFRIPLELITVVLLVLVLSVTTWSLPCAFFSIPGRHDTSVSSDWFKCQDVQELALMSQITVAHPVLTYNKEDLTLSKLKQDIVPAREMSYLKQLSYHSSNIINPLTSKVFKHPTEKDFQICRDINISCVTTHFVTHSMIHLQFNVHFLSNFEGKSPNFLTNVTKNDPILCSCRWVRSTYCVWGFHAFSRMQECRYPIASKHKGETIFHNPLLGQGE